MESTLPQTGIQHLPNEILKLILSYVPTRALLRTCRLVNSGWWEDSTEICHEFREIQITEIPTSVVGAQLCKVPWSFYIFEQDEEVTQELKTFIIKFGAHLRKMVIEPHYSTSPLDLGEFAAEILNFTPNLTILWINGSFSGKRSTAPLRPPPRYEPLRHLTNLDIRGFSIEKQEHVDWFHQLFEKSPLTRISLSITQAWGDTAIDMEQVVQKLRKVASVSLFLVLNPTSARPKFLAPFLNNPPNCPLQLKKFSFQISDLDKKHALSNQSYTSLAAILKNSADTVEKLEMSGNGGSQPFGCTPFEFPVCPKMKTLKLGFPGNENNFVTTMMSGLSPPDVPNLEALKIRDMVIPEPSAPTTLFQRKVVFETVKKLVVESSHTFRDKWEKIFPNLRKLEIRLLWQESQVRKIYDIKQLEELEIKAFVRQENVPNASQLLSGIPYSEKIKGKSDKQIHKIRQKHQLPSILQLTKLKVLKIEFLLRAVELNDSVVWTFLQKPPMDELTFMNVNMPEGTMVKLRAYQTRLEILDKNSRY